MRSLRGRLSVLVVLGALAPGVVAVGLAYACSPQASIAANPGIADSGSSVVVTGSNFVPGRAEVRWGSRTGPVLANVTVGPSLAFRTTVTIPSAQPGVYALVGVGYDAAGVQKGDPIEAFEVTAPAPAPAAATDPSPLAADPSPASSPQPDRAPSADAPVASAAPSQPGATGGRPTSSKPAVAEGTGTAPAKSKHTAPAKSTDPSRAGRPARKPARQDPARSRVSPATPASSNAALVRGPGGQAVFGASPASAKPSVTRARKPHAATAARPVRVAQQPPLPAAQPSVARSPSLSPSSADPWMQPSSPGSASACWRSAS